jgi:DNA-binding MarR family transcriptional regulator
MSNRRMKQYIPLVQTFAARVVLLDETVASLLGLHTTDVKVLRLLGDELMTAGDLVERTNLTGASVTALVDRLESAGYVTRIRNTQDRRKVGIRAVAGQTKNLDLMYEHLANEMTAVISKYSEREFATVIDYLQRTADIVAEQTRRLRGVAQKLKARA